jgi:hypothetical protein
MILLHGREIVADGMAEIERGEWLLADTANPGQRSVKHPFRPAAAFEPVGYNAVLTKPFHLISVPRLSSSWHYRQPNL